MLVRIFYKPCLVGSDTAKDSIGLLALEHVGWEKIEMSTTFLVTSLMTGSSRTSERRAPGPVGAGAD